MVNIQVWQNDENKKIASFSCYENETMTNIQKLEGEYGEVQDTTLEKDTSNKTPMIRYYLLTETHTIIVSMTLYQAERVNDYIASYEAFEEIVNETEIKNEGDEIMNENCGYDRDIVLLEKGEFECDGRTFNYDGETIFVGDLLDGETTFLNFKTVEGNNGSFHITETHHIMLMVHSYSELGRFSVNYDEIVYAPRFEEIYETASDFIEAMVGIANRYYDPSGEIRERVEYSSYKGRLLKDLVNMSADELQAIDKEGADGNFSISDVGAYIDYLNQEAHNPNTWAKGVTITEEHIDYHIRHKIEWGIEYCEKYCSPSVGFFRLADKMYKAIRD